MLGFQSVLYEGKSVFAEEDRESRKVATNTAFDWQGGRYKLNYTATKVSRQCPVVILETVCLLNVRRLEVEKAKM
jgi:hypothetical protein